jgi:hypothetical protein
MERIVAGVLVAVHLGLLAWALVGFAELLLPGVPWKRLSNPLFSTAMLGLQWSLIAVASTTFVFGFIRQWRATPWVMAAVYGAMAAVCAYQTFFVLTDPMRFRAMAIEYVEYALILVFLFRSPYMRTRFS